MKTNPVPTPVAPRRMVSRITLVLALLGAAGDGFAQRGAPRPAPTPSDSTGRASNDRFARRRQIMAIKSGSGLATGEVTDPLVIPGLASRPPAGSGINVLQRVFLDPATGELVFVGRLDPAYGTGAIDYSTLLGDAIASPTPSFSLEPTAQSRTAAAAFVRQFDQEMNRNLGSVEAARAWFAAIFDQLLTNPALEADRRRFTARGAAIFHVPPEEIGPFAYTMLGRSAMGSPPWINFWARLFEHLGAPEAATYMRAAANKENDPYAFQASLDGLGLRPTIEELRSAMQSGALPESVAYARLEVATWGAIYSRCGLPDSRWRAAGDQAARTGDTTAFRSVVDAINLEIVREKVMDAWLDGLIVSEQFLQAMHRLPPLAVAPVCSDGLKPDSELAHTFLAADWILKNLGVAPELSEKVPGHRTPGQFAFELETARRVYDAGDVRMRMWLQPEAIELRHDPAGRLVEFGPSLISVRTEVTSHGRSGSVAAQQLVRDAAEGYARHVTQRYDAYARALPELHRLREAAKVIALAQWAQKRRLQLRPPAPPVHPGPLPASFQRGFWTGNFYSRGESAFFGLVAIGGVDFGPDVGTAWVQPREDQAIAGDALRQLAASAVLGRQAAEAAIAGDLEGARALADQSARALTGELDLTGHPALGAIPEVPPPTPVTDIQLETEALLRSHEAIEELAKVRQGLGPPDVTRAEAEDKVRKLQGLLVPGQRKPEEARQYVKLLRNGEWASLPTPRVTTPPPAPIPAALPPPAPPVRNPNAAAPGATTVSPPPAISSDEQAKIRGEITALRSELCRVQAQLRRFNATIQQDQAMRAEWEIRVNEAYESALSAAKSKLADFSLDFPDEKLTERIDSLTDPAERAKYERARNLLTHLREAYRTGDFAQWAEHEEYTRTEVIEGVKIIAEIFEIEDKIKEQLSKRWGLKRVIAFQEAASDLVTAAFDVTSEVVAWRRLNQLNRNSEEYLRAVEATARRQREVVTGIHERELRLGLQPGATKDPCGF